MSYLLLLFIVMVILASSPSFKGKIGERKVKYYLSKLNPDRYVVLHDVLLPSQNGKTTQIDHVVLSGAGIFVIETKNYQGWIYGSERSKKWTQVIYKRKQSFHNPLHQNYGHIKAIENLIGSQIQPPYYSVIAFDPRSTIKKMDITSRRSFVIHSNQLVELIKKHDESVLSRFQIKGISERLKLRNIVENKAVKAHIKQVRADQQEKKMRVNSGVCPKCGNSLVTRNRKDGTGSFKGCSSFPKCRFIA
ncbi:NERD domain-containing protein [Rossellomorea aquimaris]|uniref:NERD domain-containing protein n=1 Tax=Rossellomorea aquimaris TaxID=189382 RepID=UPI001CD76AF6|nr:NERD domain-containing protein [Rossellomorea aquimaris]MCA1061396.1 NERD domain-containing protein [Rossellomorea aquimaris]